MKVRIFKSVKNSMQSGRASQKRWVVAYEEDDKSRFIEPVMGWVGSADPKHQLKLMFASKEEAISYASSRGLEYEIVEPHPVSIPKKSYANNFV